MLCIIKSAGKNVFPKFDETIFKIHLSISFLYITAVVLNIEDGPGLIMTGDHVVNRNHHLFFHGHKVLHDRLS